MRDKLKPVSDWTGRNPTTYYLHDIAVSLRELAAARSEPLDLTPGERRYYEQTPSLGNFEGEYDMAGYLDMPGEWCHGADGRYHWYPSANVTPTSATIGEHNSDLEPDE